MTSLYSRNRKASEIGEPTTWWGAPTEQEVEKAGLPYDWCVHNVLFPHVQALEEDQADQHLQNILNAKLYSNRDLMSFEWSGGMTAVSFKPLKPNLENIIQSIIDTLRARFATNRPKATVLTRGANFDIYRRGRLLDKYLWGEFLFHKVWAKVERLTVDAMVYGTGVLKRGVDGDMTFLERVHPDEIIVDQRECVSDELPLCVIQRKLVTRHWLYETFLKGKTGAERERILEAIRDCQAKDWQYTSYRTPAEDYVVLVEAWKRPTRKGGSDGRHVICIENYTFHDEPYTKDNFPFIWLKWREPEVGFYGLPLVSDLMGYQIKQDDMNELIAIGQHFMCVPRIFEEEGSELSVDSIDNDIARRYTYRPGGNPPQAMTWNAFNPEMYNERDRNAENAYKFTGMSQAMAQGTALSSQDRFDSAPARREHIEMLDTRFNHFVQRLEEIYLDVAYGLLEVSAELYTGSGKTNKRTTTFINQSVVEQIDWEQVDMPRDRYVLQIGASSVLSMSPAARTDQLERWLDDGKITIQDYYSMSGNPDLERLTERLRAKQEHAEAVVDKMNRGIPQTPSPFDWEYVEPYVSDELCRLMSLEDEELDPDLAVAIDLHMQWLEMAHELAAPAVTEPSMAPGVEEAQSAMSAPTVGGAPPGLNIPGTPPGNELGFTGVAVSPNVAPQFAALQE